MPQVVRFHQIGEPEVLQIENLDVPAPGRGEVQIAIKAIGLNRAEAMFRRGQYMVAPKLPAHLGYEAAGTIAAIGPEVSGFKIGDAVSVIPAFSFNDYGMYASLANAPAYAVVHHPASLTWEQAAAAWMQYLTPYGALMDIANLTKGDTIIIPAASSSVGLAAMQIARKVGATPVALTRGASKRRALLDVGAAHVIATGEQDLVKEISAITKGQGARVVFDPVAGVTLSKLIQSTAQHGIIMVYGALAPEPTPFPLFDVIGKGITIRGYSMAVEVVKDLQRMQKAIRFISEGLADGTLKPVIAKTFPLEQIVAAHPYLESNQQVGKIVVTVQQ